MFILEDFLFVKMVMILQLVTYVQSCFKSVCRGILEFVLRDFSFSVFLHFVSCCFFIISNTNSTH